MKKLILVITLLLALVITTKKSPTVVEKALIPIETQQKITKLDIKIDDSITVKLPISLELTAPVEDFLMYARNNKIKLDKLQDLEFIYYSDFSLNDSLDEGLFLESPSHCVGDNYPHITRDGREIDPEFFVKTWDEKRKNYYFKFLAYQIGQKEKRESKKITKAKFVTATVYNAVAAQCNKDYLHTAFMFKLDSIDQHKHKIIAVSRDLLKEYPKGTKVKVEGTSYDGIYTVMDKMGKSSKYRGPITNSIDILINADMSTGKWNKAKITKIN